MSTTDYEATAHQAGLQPVGDRVPLGEYLKELWRCRAFAITLAKYRVQAGFSQHRLGVFWVVLQPILRAAMYGLVFGVLMGSDTRPDNFIPYLVVGVFIFGYFSRSWAAGARSITGNAQMVRSLNFPRMLLPIAAVIENLLELIPMIFVLAIIVTAFGEVPSWSWLMVVPVLALMTMFNMGVALISARLTVHVRDLTQFIPLITRILFYTSGVFYSLEKTLADQPRLLYASYFNPVGDFITLVRDAMIETDPAPPIVWYVVLVSSVVLLVFGVVFFWRAEGEYGRD